MTTQYIGHTPSIKPLVTKGVLHPVTRESLVAKQVWLKRDLYERNLQTYHAFRQSLIMRSL
jgi:hypothetical protein